MIETFCETIFHFCYKKSFKHIILRISIKIELNEVKHMELLQGLSLPFIGTALGAACVFFLKKELSPFLQKSLSGFAAGVMMAASVWSLIIPAIDQSENLGNLSFIPAFIGFWVGVIFLLALDHLIPHLHIGTNEIEGPKVKMNRSIMLILAVTLHNIPEGMAVGVVYAGFLSGNPVISSMAALALALGIAIQNFPEGAIISMPLIQEGYTKTKAFIFGIISGIAELLGAIITILLADFIVPIMPYMLAFAAGAMVYVVVEELIPEASQGEHSNIGTIAFALGFSIMMVLDVALG